MEKNEKKEKKNWIADRGKYCIYTVYIYYYYTLVYIYIDPIITDLKLLYFLLNFLMFIAR